VVEPRKRPFHTIMTGFITKDGEPLMAFGNMGGGTQPQAHVQHLVNMIDLGMNVQATTDVARFDHSQESDVLRLDRNLDELVGDELEAMGHTVESSLGLGGGYQGILFERDPSLPEPRLPPGNARGKPFHDAPINGIYRGGSDHRKDGLAIGW
jgi:gamma-glutamyltranspeptidase/glutathione hydrolase